MKPSDPKWGEKAARANGLKSSDLTEPAKHEALPPCQHAHRDWNGCPECNKTGK